MGKILYKKDVVEKYIERMKNNKWDFKDKYESTLVFEKEKSKNKFLKEDIYRILFLIFWDVYLIYQIIKIYRNLFIYIVTDYPTLFFLLLSIFVLVISFIELIEKIYSLYKFRITNTVDKSIYKISIKQIRIKKKIEIMLYISVGILILFSIYFMGKDEFNKSNEILDSKMPLKLEDFNLEMKNEVENDLVINETAIGKSINFSQRTYYFNQEEYEKDKENLMYPAEEYRYMYEEEGEQFYAEIFISKYKWIIDKGLKNILNRSLISDYNKQSSGEELNNWNCEKLYINTLDERVVVYDDRIIIFNGSFDYNKENINKIKEVCLNLK